MKKSFTLVEDFFYVLNFCTTIMLLLRRILVLHQIIHQDNAAPGYNPVVRSVPIGTMQINLLFYSFRNCPFLFQAP